jgi:hypothetical protein
MFRPNLCPSSGRCVTRGASNVSQNFTTFRCIHPLQCTTLRMAGWSKVWSKHVGGILCYSCIYFYTFHFVSFRYVILTYSMQRFVASQEIPRILCNPKIHYRIQKCLPPVSILSQPNPVHTATYHFLKIHPNIILPSTPGSPQWSISPRCPHQNPIPASLLPYPHNMVLYLIRSIYSR